MSLKAILEFLKDLGAYLKRILTSRIIPFVLVMIAVFSILLYRLFYLQIIKGESFSTSYTMKTQREVSTIGPRGSIYDRNGVLLAYSELAYSIVIEDCGYYDSNKVKNATLNSIIANSINIIEDNGDKINYDFPVEFTSYRAYRYTLEGNTLQRFLRDIYGKKSVNDLTEEEKNSTADELVNALIKRYQINTELFSNEMILKIIYVRYNLSLNSYKRYVSFTLAENVSENTMAAILESSPELIGVGIKEEYIRKYNYSKYIAHIIGYTGKISESELEDLKLQDSSYTANDIVGKSGIEAAYETTLAGKKGSKTMLVDSVGRVQEVTSEVAATVGNDVYLTIDVKLQEQIYNLMEKRLAEVLVSNTLEGDETRAGIENDVVMPVTRVYFGLIDNNVISMDKIYKSDTWAATTVTAIFNTKKAEVMNLITNELENATPLNALDSDMKEYVKRIRSLLIEMDIINSEKIDSENELSVNWSKGSISLREYLIGAINNEWININNLDVSTNYPTTDEVIKVMINLALTEIASDSEFNKLIYEDLILAHVITGQQICLILMEQNAVAYTETEYVQIQNGANPYKFIINKIDNLDITPAQLALDPCSGSCVVEDPNSGELLAMVSYPSYDINLFSGTIDSEYYKQLLNDKSTPLVNRVTQTKIAPGSTFKPLTALAALTEGVIDANSTIYCDGVFDTISPSIKCHIYPHEHGAMDTESGLQFSCNVYFCQLGYLLSVLPNGNVSLDYGLSRLKKYSDMLGLSTKTGIQIPEATPRASDYNSTASAIGQGTNAYTSLNLARYVSTLANKGTVYNSNLVKKIMDSSGNTIYASKGVVANTCDTISEATWTSVHNGMERVISRGAINDLTKRLPAAKVFGKSGTAQEDKNRGNHANYIMFTKDENGKPEVAVAVMLPYAYAAANAGVMAYYALSAYYGVDVPQSVYFDIDTILRIND